MSFYKILKIGIFGKLIDGFENFLLKAKSTTKMHSNVMANKHKPHMTGLASFKPACCTSDLYTRIFNFDLPSTVFLFFDLLGAILRVSAEQVVQNNKLVGTKQIVPAKQR